MKHFASSATSGMHEGYTAALRAAAVQREEPLTSAGFMAAQLHESWGRSAAVGVGRQPTHQ